MCDEEINITNPGSIRKRDGLITIDRPKVRSCDGDTAEDDDDVMKYTEANDLMTLISIASNVQYPANCERVPPPTKTEKTGIRQEALPRVCFTPPC